MAIRKDADTRKQEIIDAAIRLADKVGPDSLTTGAVARDIGITQPGVFRHFPRKQNLWEAVANRISDRMQDRWSRVLKGRNPPDDRLRALVATQLKFIHSNPAIPAILFSRELHIKNDILRKAFYGLMGRLHGVMAGIIREGSEKGVFSPDIDAGDAAFLVLGLVQGLAVRWSLSGKNFDIVAEGQRLLDLQMAGFVPGPGMRGDGGAP